LGCPGQWAYTLGPCKGINFADDLFVSRWILHRLSEEAGVEVTLDPNPCPGIAACTGAAVRFSTFETEGPNGWLEIQQQMSRLEV
jgi:glutamine synthetase